MATRTVASFLIASGISLLLLHQFIVFYRFTRYVDTIVYDLPDGREARLRVFGYFPNERALNGGLSWLMKTLSLTKSLQLMRRNGSI